MLLILQWLSEGAQQEILSRDPVSPSPKSLRIAAVAGQWQSSPRAGPGPGSDLGCGRVPPLAAASIVTEASPSEAVPPAQTAARGAARHRGRERSSSQGSRRDGQRGTAPLCSGDGAGGSILCRKAGPCVRRSSAQMGNFCTFTAQYLGLDKSKKVVVH